jgi:hypothetical protein
LSESPSSSPGKAALPPPDAPTSLWRNRDFNIFWAGQALSNVGDGVTWVAMPLLVYQLSGSVVQMGMVTAASFLGQWAACLFAGSLVDRLDRRWLMIACDIGRMALQMYLALGFTGAESAGAGAVVLYAVAGLSAVLGTIFNLSHIAVLPSLVRREQIIRGNSRLQSSQALASIAGPMLGGAICAAVGPGPALLVDVLSFLISAVSLVFVRLRPVQAGPAERRQPVRGRVWGDLREGMRFLSTQPVLWATTLLVCGFKFMTAGGFDLIIYRLKRDLGEGDTALGFLFAVASVGGIMGAAATSALRRRLGFGTCLLGCFALAGASALFLGRLGGGPLLGVSAMGYSFGNVMLAIILVSLRQQLAPDYLQGRVTSAFWTLTLGANALGVASVTLLASRLGTSTVLYLMGVANLLLALAGIFTPARVANPVDVGATPVLTSAARPLLDETDSR